MATIGTSFRESVAPPATTAGSSGLLRRASSPRPRRDFFSVLMRIPPRLSHVPRGGIHAGDCTTRVPRGTTGVALPVGRSVPRGTFVLLDHPPSPRLH